MTRWLIPGDELPSVKNISNFCYFSKIITGRNYISIIQRAQKCSIKPYKSAKHHVSPTKLIKTTTGTSFMLSERNVCEVWLRDELKK